MLYENESARRRVTTNVGKFRPINLGIMGPFKDTNNGWGGGLVLTDVHNGLDWQLGHSIHGLDVHAYL
jgi:hypothetical protein